MKTSLSSLRCGADIHPCLRWVKGRMEWTTCGTLFWAPFWTQRPVVGYYFCQSWCLKLLMRILFFPTDGILLHCKTQASTFTTFLRWLQSHSLQIKPFNWQRHPCVWPGAHAAGEGDMVGISSAGRTRDICVLANESFVCMASAGCFLKRWVHR